MGTTRDLLIALRAVEVAIAEANHLCEEDPPGWLASDGATLALDAIDALDVVRQTAQRAWVADGCPVAEEG